MVDACMRPPAAAKYVGLAQSTLNKLRLTRDGPPFVKVGLRAVAYRRSDLDAWLASRVCRSTADKPMTGAPVLRLPVQQLAEQI